jgi:hypothetical protein
LCAEEVAEVWEPWMHVVDELSEDEELVDAVYDAQASSTPRVESAGVSQPRRR